MFTIGDRISVQDVPDTDDIDLVTNEPESAIVREYTFEELILTRRSHPEVLGAFAGLSTEDLHKELQEYDSFLVKVGDGDYSLVIGFSDREPRLHKDPTILFTVPSTPSEGCSIAQGARSWAM